VVLGLLICDIFSLSWFVAGTVTIGMSRFFWSMEKVRPGSNITTTIPTTTTTTTTASLFEW